MLVKKSGILLVLILFLPIIYAEDVTLLDNYDIIKRINVNTYQYCIGCIPEYLQVTETDNGIMMSLFDKNVELKIQATQNDQLKTDITKDSTLKLQTNIQKIGNTYIYNHTFSDSIKSYTDFQYKIITTENYKPTYENNILQIGPFKIDFTDATQTQKLDINLNKTEDILQIKGLTTMLDPNITVNNYGISDTSVGSGPTGKQNYTIFMQFNLSNPILRNLDIQLVNFTIVRTGDNTKPSVNISLLPNFTGDVEHNSSLTMMQWPKTNQTSKNFTCNNCMYSFDLTQQYNESKKWDPSYFTISIETGNFTAPTPADNSTLTTDTSSTNIYTGYQGTVSYYSREGKQVNASRLILTYLDNTPPNINFTTPTPINGTLLDQLTNDPTIAITTQDESHHTTILNFNESLITWIDFENRANDTYLYDNSNYGNNATVIGGATYNPPGARGGSYAFSGSSTTQAAEIQHNNSLNLTDAITIGLWFYANDLKAFRTLMTKGTVEGAATTYNQTAWGLEVHFINRPEFTIYGNNTKTALDAPNLQNNTWYQITCIYNKTDVSMYINGFLNQTATTTIRGLNGVSKDIGIGNDIQRANAAYNWNGVIDEVVIYNRALQPQEVKALYDAQQYAYYNTFTDLPIGKYTYKAHTIDEAGLKNSTETRILYVNETTNEINYTYPTPEDQTNLNSNNLVINITTNNTYNISVLVDWDRTLVGWYTFDKNNGTYIFDNSSWKKWASYNGTTTQYINDAPRGIGFNFNGTNTSSIIIPSNLGLSYTNLSVSLWANFSTNATGGVTTHGAFIKIGEGNIPCAGMTGSTGMAIGVGATSMENLGSTLFVLHECRRWINTGFNVTPGWQHIAVTWNSTGIPNVYYNGNFIGSYAGVNATYPTTRIYIGGYTDPTGGRRQFNGSLDDIQIYNRILTQNEIKAIYNATAYPYTNNFTEQQGRATIKAYSINSIGRMSNTEKREYWINRTPPMQMQTNYQIWNDTIEASEYTVEFNTQLSPTMYTRNAWVRPGSKGNYFHQWLWDSVFASMIDRYYDIPESKGYIMNLYDNLQSDNRLPQYVDSSSGPTASITQAPIASQGIWSIYQLEGDKGWLNQTLKPNYGNSPGLYNALKNSVLYINNTAARDFNGKYAYVSPRDEAGWDNSPSYNGTINGLGNTNYVGCTDLQYYMAKNWELLYYMAKEYGNTESSIWIRQHDATIGNMTQMTSNGQMYCYNQTGPIITQTLNNMYTIMIPQFANLTQLNQTYYHITNTSEYWSQYGLRTVSLTDAHYENDYWRGPTWINIDYQFIKGLKESGYRNASKQLTNITLTVAANGWKNYTSLYEFYSTGNGDPINVTTNAIIGVTSPNYVWSALIKNLLIEEIVGIDAKLKHIEINPYLPYQDTVSITNYTWQNKSINITSTKINNGFYISEIKQNGIKQYSMVLTPTNNTNIEVTLNTTASNPLIYAASDYVTINTVNYANNNFNFVTNDTMNDSKFTYTTIDLGPYYTENITSISYNNRTGNYTATLNTDYIILPSQMLMTKKSGNWTIQFAGQSSPNSCTCTQNGWNITASDNCEINSDCLMFTYANVTCEGTGRVTFNANLRTTRVVQSKGGCLIVFNGGYHYIP